MFIQMEDTPNPEAIKFIPGQIVSPIGVRNYISKEQAYDSLLARELFDIEKIAGIYFGYDFITVIKGRDAKWEILKPKILSVIMDFFVSGLPVITVEENAKNQEKITNSLQNSEQNNVNNNDENSEIIDEIIELIETRIRPAVANDGGDIIFHSFEDGIVRVELHGSCSGCPSSTITLKNGIENMLKYYVPEVVSVEAVE